MGAEHRVDGLGKRRRPLVVALVLRTIVVMMKRCAAFQLFAHFLGQCLVSLVAVCEQRVPACGRQLDRVEDCPLVRDLPVQHVMVKHHVSVGQHPDRLPILADVADQQDAGQ